MRDLGLAYNPNTSLPIRKKKMSKQDDDVEGDGMEVETQRKEPQRKEPHEVIMEFEKQSKCGKKHERHISPDEAKFLMDLIKTHKTNYNGMCKDKRNTYQHTAKKLQFKCESLLNHSLYEKYKSLF